MSIDCGQARTWSRRPGGRLWPVKRGGGKVYTKIGDVKDKTLKAILDAKIVPDNIVYSDTLTSYNVLDVATLKHLRVNHSKLFSEEKNHINGIENFWNQAKRHYASFQ